MQRNDRADMLGFPFDCCRTHDAACLKSNGAEIAEKGNRALEQATGTEGNTSPGVGESHLGTAGEGGGPKRDSYIRGRKS